MDTNNENPLVFISYSWDDDAHKEWVLQLANRLSNDGINVVLDRYIFSPGRPLQGFIESALAEATKVIIVFTPNYKLKAEGRTGGVGHEYSIINSELYNNQANNTKFIPVLRKGTHQESIPPFVRQIVHVDFTETADYEKSYISLLEGIWDVPPVVKPRQGKTPDWLEEKRRQLREQSEPVPKNEPVKETAEVIKEVPVFVPKEEKKTETITPKPYIPPPVVTTTPSTSETNYKPIFISIAVLILVISLFTFRDTIFGTGNTENYTTDTAAAATTEAPAPPMDSAAPAAAPPTNTTTPTKIEEKVDDPAIRAQADKDYENGNNAAAAAKYLLYVDFLSASQQQRLGYLYDEGLGVPQSYTDAMKWYKKAADKGDASAIANIGALYYFGQGVTRNYTEALNWYKKAANKGNAIAMNNIGELYYYGEGVSVNYTEAIRWYNMAAAKGIAGAMFNLGYTYEVGKGVNKDLSKAKEWYQKAADKGDKDAEAALKRLGN